MRTRQSGTVSTKESGGVSDSSLAPGAGLRLPHLMTYLPTSNRESCCRIYRLYANPLFAASTVGRPPAILYVAHDSSFTGLPPSRSSRGPQRKNRTRRLRRPTLFRSGREPSQYLRRKTLTRRTTACDISTPRIDHAVRLFRRNEPSRVRRPGFREMQGGAREHPSDRQRLRRRFRRHTLHSTAITPTRVTLRNALTSYANWSGPTSTNGPSPHLFGRAQAIDLAGRVIEC